MRIIAGKWRGRRIAAPEGDDTRPMLDRGAHYREPQRHGFIALDNDAPNHILWRAPLSAQPDTPILADIDGDGLAEIVVCTSDGYLNVLK